MAKVVKFCAACEEGFAEKFGFCPNCGGALAAYELNPIAEKSSVGAAETFESKNVSPVINEAPPVIEKNETVTEAFSADEDDELLEIDGFSQKETPAPTIQSNFKHSSNGNGQNGHVSSEVYQQAESKNQAAYYDDGGYHITFVEERGSPYRNLLLLGAFTLVMAVSFVTVIASMFGKALDIGSLNDDGNMLAYIGAVEPEQFEEEPPPKKNDDEGGGGGGGGRENPDPVTKGRLPTQVQKPIMPPQVMPQVTNASLPNPQETQGNITRPRTTEQVGLPTGSLSDRLSSGSGSGGGIGSGFGTGAGSGRGTGEGSGIGSGSGSGRGNGNGDGDGDGDGRNNPPPPPKPKPVGPTVRVQVLSKPRPGYTDAARQNQVTGVVRLKVTFLASGQIGSVSPISGLPYGLTEQAIAAAKQIRFEPAKVNGEPKTVSMTIEYTFTIY